MIKDIVKDTETLSKVSQNITDKAEIDKVVKDLIDTAMAHIDICVGLAAIQIGYPVKIFVIRTADDKFKPYINPVIINRSQEKYIAKESCLSLDGEREVVRHKSVSALYTVGNKTVKENLTGYRAEIFQHEYDHLFGKLI